MYRIAADLAGVVLTRPEMEVASRPVKAEIVNHEQNDDALPNEMPSKKSNCVVQ